MSACSTNHSNADVNTAPPTTVVDLPDITVNGKAIDKERFANEIQYHAADSIEAAVQQAGQALVVRELLCQVSGNDTVQESTNQEDTFAELLAAKVHYDSVEEADCERYYQQNQSKFQTAPILQVKHILLAAAPDDIEGRINKQQLANDIIEQLLVQPQLFQEFVTEFSDCPSKQTQGSLGQISIGQTIEEFERQLFALPEGLHAVAIESRYGYHIVDVQKRIDGKQLPFSMVADRIQRYLDHRRYRQAVADYLYQLSNDAEISGIELKLDEPNIVLG